MSNNFPQCPPSLKPIMHYLKVAAEHDDRNPVIAYWCRLHALQMGITLSAGKKNKEETNLLVALMDWLEVKKKEMSDNEQITNDVCAQATLEEYALKLFKYADEQDRAENYNKNVVKAFYTCGIVMDVLVVFGELSDDILEKQKYAKWKAAYIHNCLKNGERPIPGPNNENVLNETDENSPSTSIVINQPSRPDAPTSLDDNLVIPHTPAIPPTSPDRIDDNPAGFKPFLPEPSTSNNPTSNLIDTKNTEGLYPQLTPDQVVKAQKYCKYASSALNYDDTKTAVSNLQKALQLLQTGVDSS